MAAAALGQFGDENAVDALLEVKDGEHPEVKKAVVDAMKRIRDVRCVPLLSRWAGKVGENDQLRKAACEALGTLGDDAGMPVLHRVLSDDTVADEIRGEAARAIGMIGGPESRKHLLVGIKDERPWLRARCVEGLAILGDQSTTPRSCRCSTRASPGWCAPRRSRPPPGSPASRRSRGSRRSSPTRRSRSGAARAWASA